MQSYVKGIIYIFGSFYSVNPGEFILIYLSTSWQIGRSGFKEYTNRQLQEGKFGFMSNQHRLTPAIHI